MTNALHSMSVLSGGGGLELLPLPSRTSALAVIYVLYPTNVTASSTTASCAAPVNARNYWCEKNPMLDMFVQ